MDSESADWHVFRLGRAWFAGLLAGTIFGCGGTSGPTGPTPLPPGQAVAVLVGAGDIARCGAERLGAERTASLLDGIDGTIFTAGDNAYPSGRPQDFQNCYGPTWGRHRNRTRPVPGNHEYETAGAAGYFQYFGDNAGPLELGYYAYDAGPWRVLALNSEIDAGEGSAQIEWLREELRMGSSRCTAAIFHRPLFSSGPNGENRDMIDIWRALYDAGVDIVINGHDHIYERFARQTPTGQLDALRGIRQFTVGTGGVALTGVARPRIHSDAVATDVHGVLKLTLAATTYQWQFVPATQTAFQDSGTGTCH